mgnify:FL=1
MKFFKIFMFFRDFSTNLLPSEALRGGQIAKKG